jgi:hypothetical protein
MCPRPLIQNLRTMSPAGRSARQRRASACTEGYTKAAADRRTYALGRDPIPARVQGAARCGPLVRWLGELLDYGGPKRRGQHLQQRCIGAGGRALLHVRHPRLGRLPVSDLN